MSDLVQSRGGGSGLWRLEGSVIALATGRVLAGVSGVEEVRVTRRMHRVREKATSRRLPLPSDEDGDGRDKKEKAPITHAATLLVRDSLLYTRPDSDDKLAEFRLRPTTPARRVDPILPAATRLRIARRRDGSVEFVRLMDDTNKDDDGNADNAQGAGGGARTMMRGGPRRLGAGMNRLLVASWGYVGRRVHTGNGSKSGGGVSLPGVVERCDYTVARHDGVWHWSRIGRCPPWYGRGQCVTYLTARKVPAWRDVDPVVRTFLQQAGRIPLAKMTNTNDNSNDNEDVNQAPFSNDHTPTNTSVVTKNSPKHHRRKWLGLF